MKMINLSVIDIKYTNRRKWSTYDTVCLKKYLDEPDSNRFNPEKNPLV